MDPNFLDDAIIAHYSTSGQWLGANPRAAGLLDCHVPLFELPFLPKESHRELLDHETLACRVLLNDRPHLIRIHMIRGGSEESNGYCLVGHEIEDEGTSPTPPNFQPNQLNDAIRSATLTEAAAMIAHEINQPLSAITNFAAAANNLLRRMPSPPSEEILGLVQRAGAEARRGGEMIRQFRQRITRIEFRRTPQSLEPIVTNAIRLARHRHDHPPNIDWQGESLSQTIVAVDPFQLQQLLIHLIDNAWEATESLPRHEARIWIAHRRQEGEVWLTVMNNGAALSDANRMFEPFMTTKSGHLGMGLTISRSIAMAHEGRLWHDTDTQQRTVFTVAVPVATRVDQPRNDEGK